VPVEKGSTMNTGDSPSAHESMACKMRTLIRRSQWKLAIVLLVLTPTAHAHGIHPLWVAAALSPLAVLLLTLVLGWLARSVIIGVIHAVLVVVWVALFWLASNLVTNDYLIWAPLALYLLHTIVIIVLVGWYALGRARAKGSIA
jgi:hypothetical protein